MPRGHAVAPSRLPPAVGGSDGQSVRHLRRCDRASRPRGHDPGRDTSGDGTADRRRERRVPPVGPPRGGVGGSDAPQTAHGACRPHPRTAVADDPTRLVGRSVDTGSPGHRGHAGGRLHGLLRHRVPVVPAVTGGTGKLVDGNAKLQVSQSVANVGGPGLAGTLTHLLGAANALATVGGSYLASAWFLRRLRTEEPPPTPHAGQPGLRAQVAEGLRFVLPLPHCGHHAVHRLGEFRGRHVHRGGGLCS